MIHQNYPRSLVYKADYNQETAKKFSGNTYIIACAWKFNIADQKYIKL